ncbi:MAG TPA: energy transducer TonB [Pyrinomonadaceae bacterium]|nr:energy transducer TonB [Pyrinomonadaceae bacterium]
MRSFHFKLQPFVLLFALTTAISALGQSTASKPDWETLRPDGEEFSVLMPKGSTFETSKEPYHKMELNTRTYLSNTKPGPVFAVVSLSGIKSNPALYTEMQRINSYVDAFKTLFSPKIRKDVIAKLTLVGDKALQGNSGREYRMTIGDLSGTAQVFATRKRFYSIVYLDTKKNDELQSEFLSSFILPEKSDQVDPAKSAAAAAQAEAPASTSPVEAAPAKQANHDPKAEDAQAASEPGKRGPISAGVLNGRAISLPRPDYPADAKAAGAEGVVVIQVTVDEQGNVTEARAISGPKMLQESSVNAALQAKFSPTFQQGEAVKVTGVIVYNFGKPLS